MKEIFLLVLRNDVKAAKKQSNCAHGVRCIGYIPVVFSSLVHLKVPEQILHAVFRSLLLARRDRHESPSGT